MTPAQRCEPPEHLRRVDGWHWLAPKDDLRGEWSPWLWQTDVARWRHGSHEDSPAMMNALGYLYLTPVASPSDVARLVEAANLGLRSIDGKIGWRDPAGLRLSDVVPWVEKLRAAIAPFAEAEE